MFPRFESRRSRTHQLVLHRAPWIAFTLLASLADCRHAGPAVAPPDAPPSSPLSRVPETDGAERSAARAPGVDAFATDATVGDPTLLAMADQMVPRVAQLRGLSVNHPVARGVLDRPEILAHLRARVAHEYAPGEVLLEGEALRRLGLIPEAMDYEATVFALLEEQVAGFYDPDDRALYLAAWAPMAMQTITMAHEIVHALQDQHFDLQRFTHHARGHGDAQTAAMAVVEGDATFAMLAFALEPVGRTVRDLGDPDRVFRSQLMDTASQPRLAAAPRALRDSLVFPYRYGFALCARAHAQGGFGAIDELLRTPPASTEQVLHPEKLATREPPIELPAAMPTALAPDYVLVSHDVMGELGVRLFLAGGVDEATAAAGAAGWGGDTLMLFVPRASGVVVSGGDGGTQIPPDGLRDTVMVWWLAFDPSTGASDDAEARAFESAAQRAVTHRYAHATARSITGASLAMETSPDRLAVIARRGRTVLVLDRAPADRAEAIVRSALASPRDGGVPRSP